jgi:drug/metabolite transporter (DMT)-like permease
MNRQTFFGYFYAAAGAALFSTKAIFIKLAYMDKVDAALMLALRMVTALPFFLAVAIYMVLKLRREGRPLPPVSAWVGAVLVGFLGYYFSALLDFEGLVYITAQLERLVLFTYPVMVMVIGWLFFKGRITWMGALGAGITYAGLLVVFLKALPEGGSNTVIGTALVLGCALTFAIYQLFAKRYIGVMGSLLFTGVALSSSAIACILHYIITTRGFDFSATSRFYWLAAGCGFFATVLPSFMVNAGLSRISAQATSMIASISPLITISLAVWILGEHFTIYDAVGSAMVIAGIAVFAASDKKPEAEKKQDMAGELEPT